MSAKWHRLCCTLYFFHNPCCTCTENSFSEVPWVAPGENTWSLPVWAPEGTCCWLQHRHITQLNLKSTLKEGFYSKEVDDPGKGAGWTIVRGILGTHPAIPATPVGFRWRIKLRLSNRSTHLWLGTTGNQIKEERVFHERNAVSTWPLGINPILFSCLSSSYSMLPTLSLDGPLYLTAQQGVYKSGDFVHFINGLLDTMSPYPGSNSTIVMDNASIHKAACLRPMIEQRWAPVYPRQQSA